MTPRRPRNRLTARAALGIARDLAVRDREEQRIRQRFLSFLRREGFSDGEIASAFETDDDAQDPPERRFRESFGLVVSGLTAASLLFALTLGCTSAPPTAARAQAAPAADARPADRADARPEWREPIP